MSSGSSSPPLSPRTPAAEPEGDTPRPFGARGSTSSSPGLASLSIDPKRRPPPLSLHPLPPISSLPSERRPSTGVEKRSISALLNGNSDSVALPAPIPSNSHPEQHHRHSPPHDAGPGPKSRRQSPEHFAYGPPPLTAPPTRSSIDAAAHPHYQPPLSAPAQPVEYHRPPPEIYRRHSHQPVEYYQAPPHPTAAYYPPPYDTVFVPQVAGYEAIAPFTAIGARAPISRIGKACDGCRARKVSLTSRSEHSMLTSRSDATPAVATLAVPRPARGAARADELVSTPPFRRSGDPAPGVLGSSASHLLAAPTQTHAPALIAAQA